MYVQQNLVFIKYLARVLSSGLKSSTNLWRHDGVSVVGVTFSFAHSRDSYLSQRAGNLPSYRKLTKELFKNYTIFGIFRSPPPLHSVMPFFREWCSESGDKHIDWNRIVLNKKTRWNYKGDDSQAEDKLFNLICF